MRNLALSAPVALTFAAFALAAPSAAQPEEPVTPASVVASAQESEWAKIAPEDLLVMELAPAANGAARRVVIQLMPPPFSQPWVENIRTLARAHWWDETSVYRVVDNWVAQWGGGEDGTEAGFAPHPLPEGVVSPVASYDLKRGSQGLHSFEMAAALAFVSRLPFDHQEELIGDDGQVIEEQREGILQFFFAFQDTYSGGAGFLSGWPFAGTQDELWPIHCYAHVGVARDLAPDTGTGSELYAVIGHAPRQLDRNIAVVGRVIEGIEHLSTLPRGTAEAGVYASRAEDTPILSVRLASELPDPPSFEYLSTNSESFAHYVAVRANRRDAFYTVPAGGVDICNVQVPIRRVAAQ